MYQLVCSNHGATVGLPVLPCRWRCAVGRQLGSRSVRSTTAETDATTSREIRSAPHSRFMAQSYVARNPACPSGCILLAKRLPDNCPDNPCSPCMTYFCERTATPTHNVMTMNAKSCGVDCNSPAGKQHRNCERSQGKRNPALALRRTRLGRAQMLQH